MSKWEEWKKAQGTTRPWHIFDPEKIADDPEFAKKRLEICKACPELIKLTSQCKKCGCFMTLKAKLKEATCPLRKW